VIATQAGGDVRAIPPGTEAGWATMELRILSFRARVRAERAEVVGRLAELYPPGSTLDVTRVCDVEVAGDGGSFELRFDGQVVGIASSPAEATARVEYLINRAAAVASADQVLIHAGVVAFGDDAMILPGPSGRGKSTLVAGLCLSGLAYGSDELAVVDPDTAAVRPFAKAICLKEGGWRAVSRRFSNASPRLVAPADGGTMTRYLTPPRFCRPDVPLRVRHVVLPRRRPGASTSLVPIRRSEAIAELAEQALNLPRHGCRGVEAVVRLAAGAECHALIYDDLGGAIARLNDLTGRPDARLATRGR
jgi:hypothetical protein